MNLGELKPILTALAMPPAGLLLILAVGALMAWPRGASLVRRRWGQSVMALAALTLWLLSCHAAAVWLARHALPQVPPLEPARLATLRSQGVQAVVILGGGVMPSAPEYGQAQPSSATLTRLRYGLELARQAQVAIGFAGGVGWAAAGSEPAATEAQVAQAMAKGQQQNIRWLDDQSRDTAENARLMRQMLQADGIRKIALVTHAWHMPRSLRHFEQAGFDVLPAPTGFVLPRSRTLLEWLPSPQGLLASHWVLREWLALRLL
jgi:uncharacterized SAM-binding protein YcdF (DUF218 family)